MNFNQNTLYPAFLKLSKLQLLIVGGGETGLEKISFLLKNSPDAKVCLIAKEVKSEIKELADKFSQVVVKERYFKATDLKGVNVLILATANVKFDGAIVGLAKKLNILCNVADKPELCDFYLGSIVSKGDLKIAISTNGKSPTIAKRLRAYLEEALPDNVQDILDNLSTIRADLTGDLKQKIVALNELTKNVVKGRK